MKMRLHLNNLLQVSITSMTLIIFILGYADTNVSKGYKMKPSDTLSRFCRRRTIFEGLSCQSAELVTYHFITAWLQHQGLNFCFLKMFNKFIFLKLRNKA